MRDFFSEKADILIVDDEPVNRKIANRMLKDWFTTREAASGSEALKLVEEKKPDLVLLDVHMPGMNGHEVINFLKGNEATRDIPVVFVTADDDRETEASGLMEGADDFITKPFRQDILIQRLSRIIELHFLQTNLKEEVARQTAKAEERSKKIAEMSLQTLLTLANIIDSKDPYAVGHSSRVSKYAVLMGEALGWDDERLENLKYSALLHDIGNIGIPEKLLNNPKTLDENEFEMIKTHTTAGAEMLQSKLLVKGAEDVARHHHERFDGTGYPGGLAGNDISQEARIVAIADAFDAMNSKRVYRRALSKEQIREELIEGKGKQFDPYMLDVFMGLLDHGVIDGSEQVPEGVGIDGSSSLLQTVMQSFVAKNGEDDYDITTGLLSRTAGERVIAQAITENTGCFVFFDVDNLKKINDTNGHKSGDKVLKLMGDTMKANCDTKLCCRLGGDEFIVFYPNADRTEAEKLVQKVIAEFTTAKNNISDISVASLSAGLVMCTPFDEYGDVYNRADKALYYVKQNGKEGYSFYNEDSDSTAKTSVDINKLVHGIKTSGSYEGAMDVEYRQFTKLFEYVANLEKRYDHSFKLIMISIDTENVPDATVDEIERAMLCMEQSIRQTIRNVDIVTRYSKEQFLAILLEASSEGVQIVIDRIFSGFYTIFGSNKFRPYYTIADLKNLGDKNLI